MCDPVTATAVATATAGYLKRSEKAVLLVNEAKTTVRFECNFHHQMLDPGASAALDWAHALTPFGTPDVTVWAAGNSKTSKLINAGDVYVWDGKKATHHKGLPKKYEGRGSQ